MRLGLAAAGIPFAFAPCLGVAAKSFSPVMYEGDLTVTTPDGGPISTWKFFGIRAAGDSLIAVNNGNTTNVAVHKAGSNDTLAYLSAKSVAVPQFSDKFSAGSFHSQADPLRPLVYLDSYSNGVKGFVEKTECEVPRPESTTRFRQFTGTPGFMTPGLGVKFVMDASFDGDTLRQYVHGTYGDGVGLHPKYSYTMESHTTVAGELLPSAMTLVTNSGNGYGYDNTMTLRLKNIRYTPLPAAYAFDGAAVAFTRDMRRFNEHVKGGLGDFVTSQPARTFKNYWLAAAALAAYLGYKRWRGMSAT